MLTELGLNKHVVKDIPLSQEFFRERTMGTWNSMCSMTFPTTGLPADLLIYEDGNSEARKVDVTTPTNIGFKLAADSAAASLGLLSESEARNNSETTLDTLLQAMDNPQIFIPTDSSYGKGVFVNWMQSSTGEPFSNQTIFKHHVSTVDNAWLVSLSTITGQRFPELASKVEQLQSRIDLSFLFDKNAGFFYGCYLPQHKSFETWHYDVLSEARIASIAGIIQGSVKKESFGNFVTNRSAHSYTEFGDHQRTRKVWDGGFFSIGWPSLIVPEGKLNMQWETNARNAIFIQKECGNQHNNGYYGYSAGLGPDGQYFEFGVPLLCENPDTVPFKPIVNISTLMNIGIWEPEETATALRRLESEFPNLRHPGMGYGDTVNTETGAVQPNQVFVNQAVTLLSCWNILKDNEPQKLFEGKINQELRDAYSEYSIL